jgi:DNA polymerase-3 subunit epsilon
MSRLIVLDTETTGLEVRAGHRVIEIGAIEIVTRQRTGRSFHQYLDPEREIDQGALRVHGLSREFLGDKPKFAAIAADFLAFIAGAELIIHNAAFDIGMLDAELARIGGLGRIADHAQITDTLALARQRYPGQRNRLDDLCKRLDVDASNRQLHGALLDASLLAEVYLAMTAGQTALSLDMPIAASAAHRVASDVGTKQWRANTQKANPSELQAHRNLLDGIEQRAGRVSIWREVLGA